ncbi:hypothetical protein QVD17_09117 [Tagetes erecta]|uniref:Replication factor A C-terminal domain-containing protein n=1 Tax=Tagetes erecta TaxID=13708 RepID=A0AAD8L0B8_TARER|nr:hypothetical protein QVD17_09117 [Tagetes erecta]
MPTVQHEASLLIEKKVKLTPSQQHDIPRQYYNFAKYGDLKSRVESRMPLTDYIGKTEYVSDMITRKGIRMRKIRILEESRETIEVTLWGDKGEDFQKEVAKDKILAITGTNVTIYNGRTQLESTSATTTAINPDIPELETYIQRFKNLKAKPNEDTATEITIGDLTNVDVNQPTKQYRCTARIIKIDPLRNWFFAKCPDCSGKLYSQRQTFACGNCDFTDEPKFFYSVNTIVTDDTGTVEAVFFTNAMNDMLNISCRDLVITHRYTDQKIIPEQIRVLQGTTKVLYFNVRPDRTIAINKAENLESASTTATSSLIPTTPNPKKYHEKRTTTTSIQPDKKQKTLGSHHYLL